MPLFLLATGVKGLGWFVSAGLLSVLLHVSVFGAGAVGTFLELYQ